VKVDECADDRVHLEEQGARLAEMKTNRIEYLHTHCKHVHRADLYSAQAQKAFVKNGQYVGPMGLAMVCDGKVVHGDFPTGLGPNWHENDILRGNDERALEKAMSSLRNKIAACCDGSAERRKQYSVYAGRLDGVLRCDTPGK